MADTRISPGVVDSSFISQTNLRTSLVDSATSTSQDVHRLNNSKYIPPWTEPYIIGVAGNSGSGKTSISQKIIEHLNQPWTVLLSFDNFYKPLTKEQSVKAFNNEWDFDRPESLDLDLLVEVVGKLKKGEKAEIPVYSFASHSRTNKTTTIYGANVIIIEGLYALYDQRLLDMMDIKIYVDTDLDICLSRRLTRDILYRKRDLSGAMKQWETFVKPNAVKFLNPTMNNADLVIPRGLDNVNAIDLMIRHIQKQLYIKSLSHIEHLKTIGINLKFNIEEFPNVKTLRDTNQTRGINSIIFDKTTKLDDFIFNFNRVATLIIEQALGFLTSYSKVVIKTDPRNCEFDGLVQDDKILAVTIIRSGDCFNQSIKRTFLDIPLGKLLIQSDSRTGEPQLHFEKLPKGMTELTHKKIMLFDAQIVSGAAAIMAIQILIDHKVKQQEIILCAYLSTEIGLRRILRVFPDVNIVIGKLSSMNGTENFPDYNQEKFLDTDWHFRHRFIDSLYFGTP
ncbi:uridine kinase [[Candida] jaroonii]|uniref:Uridine kinase n=1 Tax=[Candida] jaroonii TaxID=467808 RepID=A0ACA9YE27_9ASCO|nr:uridine kinase [[Candida] jaroonii]